MQNDTSYTSPSSMRQGASRKQCVTYRKTIYRKAKSDSSYVNRMTMQKINVDISIFCAARIVGETLPCSATQYSLGSGATGRIEIGRIGNCMFDKIKILIVYAAGICIRSLGDIGRVPGFFAGVCVAKYGLIGDFVGP